MSNLIETKSLLAKLMATENIHIEQRKVSTASFDLNNRVLTVPVLNNDVDADTYDLFMGHEVGHALYTDIVDWQKALDNHENMSVLNVVEDFRIEKKIKYKYPGLKNVFIRAYNGLFARDFFKTAGKDLNGYNLIDRINLHCKVGANLNIKFSEQERALLNDLESVQTFDEGVLVQRKIVEFMKLHNEDEDDMDFDSMFPEDDEGDDSMEPPSNQDGEDGVGEKDDEKGTQSETDLDNQEQEEGADDAESNSKGAGETEEKPSEKGEQEKGEKESTGTKGAGEFEEEIRSLTDDAFKQNEQQLFDSERAESVYVNAPKVDLDKVIVDFKDLYKVYDHQISKRWDFGQNHGYDTEGFIQMRNSLNKTVSYLVKEFELRKNAEQMKKASTAKTGDLNLNKIFSYQFNEDIFKKLTVTSQGKSHGLVMFIDWSGSMSDHLYNTVKQLFNLVMFCKKVNIPYEVYAFSDAHGLCQEYSDIQIRRKNDLVVANHLRLLNILSSRMNASQFSKAASALVFVSKNINHYIQLFQLGGTPLNDTILAAMEVVPEFQKKNRLQIVNTVFLTDGESNGSVYYVDNHFGTSSIQRTAFVKHRYMNNEVVLRDEVTRHEVTIKGTDTASYTNAYIKLLKLRTNSNIIGFYLLSNFEAKRGIYKFYPNKYEKHDDLYSTFKKSKHLVVTSQGYDEYYLLKSDRPSWADEDEEDTFNVRGTSVKSIANAFAKHTGNKMNNRTVLNRFIGLIS